VIISQCACKYVSQPCLNHALTMLLNHAP
jgi:hypothetical protein